MQNIKKVLLSFPKDRPPLSPELEKIYLREYKNNRDGKTAASSAAQKLETWMHKKVATSSISTNNPCLSTLEIGSGTLNHLQFESPAQTYDIIEPMHELYHDNSSLKYVRHAYTDITQIAGVNKYDRIISIAVLEHVVELPKLIARSIQLLRNDGIFCSGIPSEGGLLWGLAWRITTGLEFKIRTGHNYKELMRHEHINSAEEIEQLLHYFFEEVKVERLGVGKHFSLYSYLECRRPKSNIADQYLGGLTA